MIELTDRFDRTIAEAMVSIEDLPRVLARGRWFAQKKSHTTYCRRSTGRVNGSCKVEHLHRFLLSAPDGMEGDHINGNGLDNRQENIRLLPPDKNKQNRKRVRAAASSGKQNVYFDTRSGKWRVKIMIAGRVTCRGTYATIEEAAAAAEEARRALHTHCPENSNAPDLPNLTTKKGVM